jgi:hypothetical protein
MNHIAEGLGAIDNTPSGGFAKGTIKWGCWILS